MTVSFLASVEARYITGVNLNVDEGQTTKFKIDSIIKIDIKYERLSNLKDFL